MEPAKRDMTKTEQAGIKAFHKIVGKGAFLRLEGASCAEVARRAVEKFREKFLELEPTLG